MSQIISKLLGGEKETLTMANEVDHNNIICCGTVNIMDPGETSDDEKELPKGKKHGDKNIVHRFKDKDHRNTF